VKLDKEIEEIRALLESKLKEREAMSSSKEEFDVEIDKSRSKYRDQIVKLEKQLDKIAKEEEKNQRDLEDQKRENSDLGEYEESYKTRIEGF
jgi:chromosome segregation ATPase